MIYLTEDDVLRLLPMQGCVRLMESAFQRLAAGKAINHPRRRLILPSRSVLHYMVASDGEYFGAKIYSTHPRSGAHFLFLLFRETDGVPLAVVEANHLGRIRTGAASGLATKLLARPESRTAAIIGSGFQARTQWEAALAALPLASARVWSRSEARRTSFAAECTSAFGVPVEAAATAEEAVRGADILITATNAATPVVRSEWVGAGVHINAIGANQAQRRELPEDLVRRSQLIVVDSLEQATMESGDLLMALDEPAWRGVKELREVVSGEIRRTSPEEITLFKSNGLAVEDVAAAGYVYERAVESGAGCPLYS